MKEFFISIFLAISSLFGSKAQLPPPMPIITEFVEDSSVSAEVSVSPTLTLTKKIILTPSISPGTLKTKASVTEVVLKKFFNQTEQASIERILNNPSMLQEYEKYFYDKFKKFPIPRLDISAVMTIPSKNGPINCTGEQMKKLYSEIEKVEKEYLYLKMDFDCHYSRTKMETKECQDWRRDNDQARKPDSNSNQIDNLRNYQEKMYSMQNSAYNNLVDNLCVGKL